MGSFFINSGIAWAVAGLVSIPIIIHLLNRRRFRRIDWAAMEYLLQAIRKNRRRIRLEHLLLLLLRILLMGLVGFALARPVLHERGLEWFARAFRSEDKIFVLDDSYSTACREASRTVFQRQVAALGETLRRLNERGTGDRITLYRGSRPRQPLRHAVLLDSDRLADITSALEKSSPTDVRLPLAATLESIADAAFREEEEGVGRPRVVSILTDLRATDWTDGQSGPDETLARALKRLQGAEENPAKILVFDAGSDGTGNVAITDVTVEGGQPMVGIPTNLRVQIRNFGSLPSRGLGLRLEYASVASGMDAGNVRTALGPPVEELEPGEMTAKIIPSTFRSVGHYGLTVILTGANDALADDDRFPVSLEVVEYTETLLLNGEPSSERVDQETVHLELALAPYGDVPSGIKPTVVVPENLPRHELDRYSAIFLANLDLTAVPQEFQTRLVEYVQRGGALIVFLGDQVDAAIYNRQLGPPAGILPARIGERRDSVAEPVELVPALDHQYFQYLRKEESLLHVPATTRFHSYFSVEPLKDASVSASLSDQDGSAFLVERAAGKGRVILFASSADLEWSNWPRNATYLSTLHEILRAIVEARAPQAEYLAGAPVEIPVDLASHALEGVLRGPDFPTQPERIIYASPAKSEAEASENYRFAFPDTRRTGLYALGLKTRDGDTEWDQIAVRRDPAESDLSRVTATQLRQLYPDVDITVVKDPESFAASARGNFEISDLLLWLFLAFLLVESFLAWRWAHHKKGGAG